MKYIVWYGRNHYTSNSRNARHHLQQIGADVVYITDRSGNVITQGVQPAGEKAYATSLTDIRFIQPPTMR